MPRARYIPELLPIHAEDLAFVWGQRRQALNSPEHTQRDYADLSERLEAHVQGLLCAPPQDLLELLGPALAAAEADESFAAAYALLRTREPGATKAVVVAFSRASGPALQGLREALSTAAPALVADEMGSALQHAKPATAVAAAAVLASHRLLAGGSLRLKQLLEDAEPATAALAWRAALLADHRSREGPPARPYAAAVSHDDAGVRDAAWGAVAWAGQAQARTLLRQRAAAGDRVALRWWAALGQADEAAPLQHAVMALEGGSERCALLARHGHPEGLKALVAWMKEADEATAVAAGEAFELITGIDVRGHRRQLAVAPDADEFEREMSPLAWFPDADKAQAALERHAGEWAAATRWRRGVRVDPEPDVQLARQLDMQARWDIAARSALGGATAPPPPLA